MNRAQLMFYIREGERIRREEERVKTLGKYKEKRGNYDIDHDTLAVPYITRDLFDDNKFVRGYD